MPVWGWIVAAVLLVAAAVIVAVSVTSSRRKTARPKEHYAREYERLAAEGGGPKAAEKELTDRERQRDKLEIVPLTPSALADFASRWHRVQIGFVDDPAAALGAADRLVTEVMHERGYPVDNFEQRAADISVDHPKIVENYRAAHGIHLSQQGGDVGTNQQRQAFVHYRELFEKLLEATQDDTSQEATA
jgi:hypothetical protein